MPRPLRFAVSSFATWSVLANLRAHGSSLVPKLNARVQALKARGLTCVVECGPGKVLAGLVKRIDPELNGLALLDPASLAAVRAELLGTDHE